LRVESVDVYVTMAKDTNETGKYHRMEEITPCGMYKKVQV